MIEFQQKKKVRKILYSPVVLIILTIILFILIRGSWNVRKKAELSLQNLERDQTGLQKMIEREKNLTLSLEFIKTDKGVESEIRSKFRAVKDGEKLAAIVDEQSTTTETIEPIEEHGFWYKLFKWFVI